MKKNSILTDDWDKCYICGRTTLLHKHHCIKGTANRKISEKYGLNGLFNIDDTKDSDSTNTHGKDGKETTTQEVTNEEILKLFALAEQAGYSKDTVFKQAKEKYKKEVENLKKAEYNQLITGYTKLVKLNEKK